MLEVASFGHNVERKEASEDEADANSKSLVTTGLQLTQRGAYAGAAVVQFATGSSK
jgi:hypothetical protein